MRFGVLFLAAFLFLQKGVSQSQEAPPAFDKWLKFKEGFRIEPFLMFQLWSLYSINEEIYQSSTQAYEPVDDRFNVELRRARIGFRAQPFEDLRLTVLTAYDLIGRDALTGTVGGTNNASVPALGIWDAFLEWRLIPKSERLFLAGAISGPSIAGKHYRSMGSVFHGKIDVSELPAPASDRRRTRPGYGDKPGGIVSGKRPPGCHKLQPGRVYPFVP
ncbi:MAG: hypothetical protein IPK21_04575 [Haliscomenobacter sp.]|nr:hypothetical protein [Haliscomenobacter sp.]